MPARSLVHRWMWRRYRLSVEKRTESAAYNPMNPNSVNNPFPSDTSGESPGVCAHKPIDEPRGAVPTLPSYIPQ